MQKTKPRFTMAAEQVDDNASITSGDVDDSDIAAIETAIDGLLDKVQENLGFPYSTDPNPPPPNVALDYHFSASLEVFLTTQWTIFESLTLTNITLQTAVDKFKNSPGDHETFLLCRAPC